MENFKINKDKESLYLDKKEKWEQVEKDLDIKVEKLSKKIDDGIKETVIVFNVMGFPTTISCEGHEIIKSFDETPFPFVEITAKDRPRVKYKKGTLEESEEYLKWKEKAYELYGNFTKLIDEFYSQNTPINEDVKIIADIGRIDEYGFDIRPMSGIKSWEEFRNYLMTSTLNEKDGQIIVPHEIIQGRRAEMKRFTDFLKNKFFKSA